MCLFLGTAAGEGVFFDYSVGGGVCGGGGVGL